MSRKCFPDIPYKTTRLHYCEMEAGVQAENLTVVETDGKKAVQID